MEQEQDLVRRAQSRSADAFRELVRLHQAQVHSFLGRYLTRLDVVEDLAQETFLEAYRHLPTYRHESSFRVWLLSIAKNEALMHLRAERSRRMRETASFEATLSDWMADQMESDSSRLEDQDRRLVALEDCVKGLAPESATLVDGVYFKGRALADVARTSGRREGTVRMTLLRIRQALRECVEVKLAARRALS
jgi:RNA polymerase sigma-70 factor, ECF subfamily